MGFPLRTFVAGALAAGAVLTLTQPVHSKMFFAKASGMAFLLGGFAWGVWWTFVYPKFLSPLRHIPSPPGKHWLWGHAFKIIAEPSGQPARTWFVKSPPIKLTSY